MQAGVGGGEKWACKREGSGSGRGGRGEFE